MDKNVIMSDGVDRNHFFFSQMSFVTNSVMQKWKKLALVKE